MIGEVNLKNVALAVGMLARLYPGRIKAMADSMLRFPGVSGRLERVANRSDDQMGTFVDYAHTPDALRSVLVDLTAGALRDHL